ncbi:MAG: ankyrin repeat domain-containing protein [Phycisphaeraceae bacterium]|nr:ankyrin repeat domain-containing protein [Phycisphaeraceae bacterium]
MVLRFLAVSALLPIVLGCQSQSSHNADALTAAIAHYPERVPVLLSSGELDLDQANSNGMTPLQAAIRADRSYPYYTNEEIVRDLLSRGADPGAMDRAAQDEALRTFCLVKGEYPADLVVELLDRELDPNAAGAERSPWFTIDTRGTDRFTEAEYRDVADALIRNGIELNPVDHNGNSALHELITSAAHFKYVRSRVCAEKLIEAGADLGVQNRKDQTPLHLALSGRDVKMAQLLIDAGAPLDVPDNRGYTAQEIIDATKALRSNLRLPARVGHR